MPVCDSPEVQMQNSAVPQAVCVNHAAAVLVQKLTAEKGHSQEGRRGLVHSWDRRGLCTTVEDRKGLCTTGTDRRGLCTAARDGEGLCTTVEDILRSSEGLSFKHLHCSFVHFGVIILLSCFMSLDPMRRCSLGDLKAFILY